MTDSAADMPIVPDPASVDAEAAAAAPEKHRLFRRRTSEVETSAGAAPESTEVVEIIGTTGDEAVEGESPERIRPGVLRRRRRRLLGQYEQGIFDLGGLALELYGRGLLAEEVMRRRAAEVNDLRGQVHQVDDQLDDIKSARAERRQSGRGPSITCPECGARSKPGANFCAQCGTPLGTIAEVVEVEQDTIVITDTRDQPTQVISSDSGDSQATQAIPMPGESESKS